MVHCTGDFSVEDAITWAQPARSDYNDDLCCKRQKSRHTPTLLTHLPLNLSIKRILSLGRKTAVTELPGEQLRSITEKKNDSNERRIIYPGKTGLFRREPRSQQGSRHQTNYFEGQGRIFKRRGEVRLLVLVIVQNVKRVVHALIAAHASPFSWIGARMGGGEANRFWGIIKEEYLLETSWPGLEVM